MRGGGAERAVLLNSTSISGARFRIRASDAKTSIEVHTAVIQKLALWGIAPAGLLFLFAPVLFATVFGPEWRQSGEYLRILAPTLFLQLIVVPIARTLVLTRKLALQFLWEVLRLSLAVICF